MNAKRIRHLIRRLSDDDIGKLEGINDREQSTKRRSPSESSCVSTSSDSSIHSDRTTIPEIGKQACKDMETLREIRNTIQQDPQCVDLMAKEGMIKILLGKLEVTSETNQILVLQILASLGYLVQKSLERTELAIELGAFTKIIHKLKSDSMSEGVLLLGVQVITFLVEDSTQRLEQFHDSCGVEACLKILQRGCVRSSLLNARVATLLARIANHYPSEEISICKQLLYMIERCVAHMHNLTTRTEMERAKLHGQVFKAMDDTCITLTQGLGLLLDNKPKRSLAIFNENFIETIIKLLSHRRHLSHHLVETVCWTMTYAMAENAQHSKSIFDMGGHVVFVDLIKHTDRLEDNFIQAYSSVVSHLIDGGLKCSGGNNTSQKVDDICKRLIENLEIVDKLAQNSPDQENSTAKLTALHSTGNVLRAIRRITKLGGHPLEVLCANDVFRIYINLLTNIKNYPACVKAEVLQELGLLVENSPRLGLLLAKQGACEQLIDIIQHCASSQELCNATRALACFVEHSGSLGNKITDMALEKNCVDCLIDVLCNHETNHADQEVLLNTVGALGYIVKRQSAIETYQERVCNNDELDDEDRYGSLARNSQIYNSKYTRSSVALVNLLSQGDIGESLTWNALWALIYLMSGSCRKGCIDAVLEAGGIQLFTNIITASSDNQPLLCSAAKAMHHALSRYRGKVVDTLPLDVRLKVLTCAIRSRPVVDTTSSPTTPTPIRSSSTESSGTTSPSSESGGGSVDIVIDPSNIANSSAGVLHKFSGEELRNKGLRVQYVTEEQAQIGIDAGGIRRDWLSRLSTELFDPKFGLVIAGYNPNDSVQISPKPTFNGKISEEDQHKWYNLLGKILGLSVLYNDPLGIALVPSMCKLLLEADPEFEDVRNVSNQYYTTFSMLKHLRETDQAQFEEALNDLTFTVNSRECMMKEAYERDAIAAKSPTARKPPSPASSKNKTKLENIKTLSQLNRAMRHARADQDRDLIRRLLGLQNEMLRMRELENDTDKPRGSKRKLSTTSTTSEDGNKRLKNGAIRMKRMMSDLMDGGGMEQINPDNFEKYLDLLTFKLLVENVAPQMAMVKQGFHEIIPRDIVIDLLTPEELSNMIEGDRTICVQNWKKNTRYQGGNEKDTKQVKWFWDYVADLDVERRQKLLLWATGWRSIGRTGFAHRYFTIELTTVTSTAENERLPSVATCGFHLWLPKYSTKQQLVEKFELAMRETSFGNC
uniref:HECT-type E3 ubiquitin transferase n=1 Tax=Mucochytrium quahogii TaxID=96639 RepID=A0A7S2SLV7_9STRA|mmetsp:Transcript_16164/g.27834  ORF Transcript_16164/g.27834 Transcript_16164/m.27834 type:complete len:1227 (+) Transcript_16164:3851-7531(+)